MSSDYEDLFNFSLDILCINGLDGFYRLVNPAFEKLLGYPADEIKAKHFLEFIHPDDRASTREEMKKRVNGRHTKHFQNRYRRADGTYVWIEWTSFPVPEKGVMYAVGHDITERKRAEEIRLQLEQEKAARIEAERGIEVRNDFISIASHELKTPLTSLTMHTQLINSMIQDGTLASLPQDTQQKLVDLTQRQLNRLTNLTGDLLNVSRISAGLVMLDLQASDLSQIVQNVLESSRIELEKCGCLIEAQLEPRLMGIWDSSRVEQVVTNLLSNAMKFGKGRPIRIVTQTDGGVARLLVQDQGLGIRPEDQARIFERFERAVPIKTHEGLGLGLYIAHQFVAAHGGTLRVKSALNKGSTFIAELPLATREQA